MTTRIFFWQILCLLFCFITLPAEQLAAQDAPEPVVAGDGTLRRIRVPVLMYHYISSPPPDADIYRINLSIDPALFKQHLDYLRANDYSTISLDDLHTALLTGKPLPARPVILTFDDGYTDHYTNAFPLLRAAGYSGTFFIITGFADNAQAGYMNWQQIREMSEAGMQIESHTKSHPDLRAKDYDFLVYQILGSLESIMAHTDRQARFFCYPGGRYDTNTLAVLESTHILRAVTTQPGSYHTTDNYFELPRLRITNETGVPGLAHLLQSF